MSEDPGGGPTRERLTMSEDLGGGHKRERLDARLVREGLYPTREAARRAVMAGLVRVGGTPETKPGHMPKPDATLEVIRPAIEYVSRGGLKLAHALQVWPIEVQDRIALDIGASTGGFTDVLLQRGARRVYAVDVGYGQLAWSLRQDPRVVVRERTNIRHLTPRDLYGDAEPARLATIDVSFIGLDKVLPAVMALVRDRMQPDETADVVALVKPQFEAGREHVGKKGVVRDPAVHASVMERVGQTAQKLGFQVAGTDRSPITGPEGNVEFLLWLKTSA